MTFEEWLEENREALEALLRSDQLELAYKCWLAGYEAGLNEMGHFTANLFNDIR
jgi:hypothetical protein